MKYLLLLITFFIISCDLERTNLWDPTNPVDKPKTLPDSIRCKISTAKTTIAWGDAEFEKNYIVEKKIGNGNWLQVAELPKDSRTYSESGINYSSEITYRVKSYNSDKEQQYSDYQYFNFYTISGNILTPDNQPLANADLIGFPYNLSSDSNGVYSALLPKGWSGVIAPKKYSYTFNPESKSYTNLANSQITDFTAIPNIVPEVSITSPLNNAVITIGNTIEIKVDASDNKLKKDRSVTKVDFFIDDVLKASDTSEPFVYNWNTTGMTARVHNIKAVVSDNYGAINENLISVNLNYIPDITITAPIDGSNHIIGSNIKIVAMADDSENKLLWLNNNAQHKLPFKMRSIVNVKFYINGVLKTIDDTAPYEYNWNSIGSVAGSYFIKAVITDDFGASAEKQIAINLHNVPTVAITAPANGSNHLIGSNILLSAIATDIGKKHSSSKAKTKSIANVKFYINDFLKATDDSAPYEYLWNSTGSAVGSYTIKAVTTDDLGANSEQQILVNLHSAPTVVFTTPLNNALITIGNTVNITATAVDSKLKKGRSVAKVDFFIDGVLKGTDNSEPYSYNWNTAGLTIGTHAIKAVVTDNFNVTAENQVVVNLNQVPTVNITSPVNGSNHLIGSNILLSATSTDIGKKHTRSKAKTKSIANVKFYINDILKATDNSAPYEYLWNSTGSAVGSYIIKAVTTDDLGANSEQQILVNLHFVPTVAITSPLNNALITIGNTVNITATTADSKLRKGRSVAKVDFFIDGVLKGTDNSEPYSYNWNTAGLTVGTHAIKTVVTDDFNVTAENQISVNLNAAPDVSITAPANGSAHLIGSTILIKASASDSGKKLFSFNNSAPGRLPFKNRAVANVKFYINNVLKAADDTAPFEYSWNSSGLNVGNYTLKAVVTDDLGASAEEVISVVLHIAPTVHITNPANNAVITLGSTVNVTATIADSKSKAVSRVDFYIDGELRGTDNASPFAYSWNTAGLSIGAHAVKAVVTDDYNLIGEEQISVNLNASPTIQITAPENNSSFIVGSFIEIAASAIDYSKKSSKINGGFFNNIAVSLKSVSRVEFYIDDLLKSTDEAAPYEFAWNTTGVALGSHEIKAKAVDSDGAIAIDSVEVIITTTEIPGMVLVWGGTFQMGDVSITNATPLHTVTLSTFYIGKYEVSQAEWITIMGVNPSYYTGDVNRPVEQISWFDIIVYCNKRSITEGKTPCYSINGSTDPASWGAVPMSDNEIWNAATCNWSAKGYRMPTEAEWEFASRGGNSSQGYTYSGSNNIGDVAWYYGNSQVGGNYTTHTVGTKAPNELNIYDMTGNVWEWSWDWHGSYNSSAQTNPYGATSGSNRICRGGSVHYGEADCRVAIREYFNPAGRYVFIGFRLVCSF